MPEEPTGPRVRLGDWLRAERLRRGFSYDEIARDTRISRQYLEALEAEHFDVIPAPVYTRGFLRAYARALGLDPETAIAMLPTDLPRPPGLEPSESMRRNTRETPAVSLPQLPSLRLPSMRLPSMARLAGTSDSGSGVSLQTWLLAGAGALLLIVAAFYAPRMFTATPSNPPAAAETPGANAPASTAAPGSQSAQPGTAGRMPNLVGQQQAPAQKALQDLGLTYVTVEIASPSSPTGTVVGQSPIEGTSVNRGDNVTLIVSRGAPR